MNLHNYWPFVPDIITLDNRQSWNDLGLGFGTRFM